MYGIRSGPPTSYERDSVPRRSAPASASTTSTTAIGCTRLSIHAGMACTGIRSLIWRTISKLVDPEPVTIAARRVMSRMPELAPVRMRSTSSREVMCSDSSSSGTSGTSPLR